MYFKPLRIIPLFVIFLAGFQFQSGYSQPALDSTQLSALNCKLRISLLTCDPGEDLYTTFGHSAIRVIDSAEGSDRVYNYGTFDFSDPTAFYVKFIKGGEDLKYFLSVDDFPDFMREYEYYQRSIREQELNLNCGEKTRLKLALVTNSMGENKFYKYDFLFDNCSTRPYEIIAKNLDSPIHTSNVLPSPRTSFRDLIRFYLIQNKMYWSWLGIDILLGSRIDRPMTNLESNFLPDYLEKGFDNSTIGSKNLVSKKTVLYAASPMPETGASLITPAIAFNVLLLIMVALNILNFSWTRKLSPIFDFLLFFATGLVGSTILFMWLGTDHTVCRNNYNLLWAFPPHLIAAFLIPSRKKWVKRYWLFAMILALLVLFSWFLLPQRLNIALLPIVILLSWRSWSIYKKG